MRHRLAGSATRLVLTLFALCTSGLCAKAANAGYLVLPIYLGLEPLSTSDGSPDFSLEVLEARLFGRLLAPTAPVPQYYAEASRLKAEFGGSVLRPVHGSELRHAVRKEFRRLLRPFLDQDPFSQATTLGALMIDQFRAKKPHPSSPSDLEFFPRLVWNRVAQNTAVATALSKLEGIILLIDDPDAPGSHGYASLGKTEVWVPENTWKKKLLSVSMVRGDFPELQKPSGDAPISGKFERLDFLIAHELGHMLGLVHASGWDCGEQVGERAADGYLRTRLEIPGNCRHVEYGNSFDVMGNGSGALGLNGYYRKNKGWLDPSEIISRNASGGRVEYTEVLSPLGSSSGTKLIEIGFGDPLSSGATSGTGVEAIGRQLITLESRRVGPGSKFDQGLEDEYFAINQYGVLVNWVDDRLSAHPTTKILELGGTWESSASGHAYGVRPSALLFNSEILEYLFFRPRVRGPEVLTVVTTEGEVEIGPVQPLGDSRVSVGIRVYSNQLRSQNNIGIHVGPTQESAQGIGDFF